MRFTHIDINFDVRYESHQNCPKILSMNILSVFSDHHLWRQNWCQYLWTSLCQFNFFVNLLHSLGVSFFDIWHLFDNLTSFWQLDIFLIFLGANHPWAPLPMWPTTLYPIAHMAHTPCTPYPLCPHPCTHTPQWASLPICPIPPVSHCPCDPLPMWPIPLVPHTPCAPLPIGPIPLYPIARTPVPHIPCAPIAHRPHRPYPLYPIPLYTIAPLPITPAPHWVMGHMGNGGNGVQGVWAIWAMGPMGNVETGDNGVQGIWGTWAMRSTGGMGYRAWATCSIVAQGVSSTRGMGHMGNRSHGQWGIGPIPLYPIAHTPVPPLSIGPMAHVAYTPCTPYPLYTIAPLPITPAPIA